MSSRRRHKRSETTVKLQALLDPSFEKLSYSPNQPPKNYIFVAKGDLYVTRHCRDLTRQAGEKLHVVFDQKTRERLGLHCPIQIYETVEEDAAASAEKRQRAVANKDQREITYARDLLFRHFPRIPEASAEEILKHGFLKGSGRVGRSTTLDEELKIELAVNAHIRHRFTDYDSLYSQMKAGNIAGDLKKQARTAVYGQVKNIAYSWRELGAVHQSASSAGSIEISDTPNGMMSELEGVEDEASDTPQLQLCYRTRASHQGRGFASELHSQRQRPPQRQAAIVAALSFEKNHSFEAQVTESPANRATLEKYPSRLHRDSGKIPGTKALERALDHMNLDDEALKGNKPKELSAATADLVKTAGDVSARREHRHVHHTSANRDLPAGKSRPRPIIAGVYEEQAKRDMELLKLDINHRENMTKRRMRAVARLEKTMSTKDIQDAPSNERDSNERDSNERDSNERDSNERDSNERENKGQPVVKEAAHTTDPKRAAKLVKRKQAREKHAIDDLKQYELDPNIKLPRKRMNRVRNMQEKLAKEYGNRQYQEILEKRRRDFKAEPCSSRPDIGPKGEAFSKVDGHVSDLDWMDIS